MVKISQKNLYKGIQRSEIRGKHRLEKNLSKMNEPHLKTSTDTLRKSKINQRAVEDAEFAGNNTDRRGFRNKLEFRGHLPVRWEPQKDFTKMTSGYSEDGGAFKGGEDGTKKGNKNDYSQSFGTKKGINPFPIKVSKSIKV